MHRFSVNNPFDRNRKVVVVLEGNFGQKEALQLQSAINRAAIGVLSPDYLLWLSTKGGPCPAAYPDLLSHVEGSAVCSRCGGKTGVVDTPTSEAKAKAKTEPEAKAKAKTEPEAKAKDEEAKTKGKAKDED